MISRRRWPSLTYLAGVLALAACSDSPAPLAPSARGAKAGAPTGAQVGDRNLVMFRSQTAIPSDFPGRVKALGGKVEAAYQGAGIATVTGLTDAAASKLARASDVAVVMKDFEYRVDDLSSEAQGVSGGGAVVNDFTQATWCEEPGATAHFCNRQWNYGAIHAVEAWQAGKTGSSAVKVAILDSGIDWTYPDLTPLVDLGHSAAFVSDQAVMATFFPGTPWNAQTAVLDLAGHGTHVASTVASRSQIVAGVTKNTTLWAVKVLDATGSGPFSAIVGGYLYAIQNGADVINLSLGATLNRRDFSARGGNGPSAIAFFNRLTSVAKQANVLVVAAAGNSATNLQADKNAYDLFCSSTHVICVGATGPTAQFPVVLPTTSDAAQQLDVWNHWTPDVDAPSIFSNFGRGSIDVAAPGGNYTLTADGALVTVSFVWQACSHFLLNYDPETKVFTTSNCSRNPNTNRTVGYVGTSMASPHVAGLAALLEAEGITDPTRLRATITQTADRIGGRSGSTPSYGAGRINVARALGLPVIEW